jgi:hypothetical protein
VQPQPKRTPDWAAQLAAIWSSFHAWLMRPRVRLSVTGVTLLLIGGLVTTNSVWTLPLVIVGALMVAIAWMGHRLEGRFAVEWGPAGTDLAFRASVKPAAPTPEIPVRTSPGADEPAGSHPASTLGPHTAGPHAAGPHAAEPDEVIEGVAHTVEIDVAELKALIAAVESAEAQTAPPDAAGRDIRVHRMAQDGERPSEATH